MTQAQPRNAPGNLTTRQDHPVENNQNSRTIGARGPAARPVAATSSSTSAIRLSCRAT